MKRLAIAGLLCLLAARAFAACPTTSLTFKDAGGTTQTLCFGGASGAFIPQYQILDSGGTNALGVNASGQITIANTAFTANAGTNLNTSALALDTSVNGLLLGQGSTTSGQKGPLALGAVTTAAPTYTTAQSDPLSLTTAGALRIDGSSTTQPVNLSQIGGSSTAQGQVAGSLLVEQGCAGQSVANTSIATINLATSTGTTIVTGIAAKKIYICSINLVAGAAVNVALVEGTTATCATGITGMAGGATAATGWNLAANGGLTLGNGQGLVFKTATAADNVCLLASASSQLSGSLTYAQF